MIKSKLHKLMGENKYKIQDVHEKTGLNRNTIANLYNEKISRIDFDTLDKLCRLFNCSVCDLLEYAP